MLRTTRTAPNGFTLIEMLTVVFIILILIGILLTALGKGSAQARRTLAGQMLDSIAQAVTSYKMGLDEIPPSDVDGSVVSWAWDFGDGTTANQEITSHTYDTPGTYTATLTVTDDDGATDTDSVVVTVLDPVATGVVAAINAGGGAYTSVGGIAYSADT
ncbi:MAG: PKD domain-containing protein, partial [Phycisphaeraceae bacterium]|nr:PKD domain-containing protein [Phycisphaeraceae bacterium]